jgi:hypothetical protein
VFREPFAHKDTSNSRSNSVSGPIAAQVTQGPLKLWVQLWVEDFGFAVLFPVISLVARRHK